MSDTDAQVSSAIAAMEKYRGAKRARSASRWWLWGAARSAPRKNVPGDRNPALHSAEPMVRVVADRTRRRPISARRASQSDPRSRSDPQSREAIVHGRYWP